MALRRFVRRVLCGAPSEAPVAPAAPVSDAHEALPVSVPDDDASSSLIELLTPTPGKELPMPSRYLAWIIPVQTDAHPEHPIVIPDPKPEPPPLGTWGGSGEPFPTPPIYIQIPPGIVDGKPEHPIWWPVYPAHPIVIPPGVISPGPPLIPAHPIYIPPSIWGPNDPRPTHPIYLPPSSISPGVPAHPIYLPPVISGPPGPWPTPPIHIPEPIVPPVSPGTPENPIAYPIDIYARIPGVGIVGPITIHWPGPLPVHHGEQQARRR